MGQVDVILLFYTPYSQIFSYSIDYYIIIKEILMESGKKKEWRRCNRPRKVERRM
uniref:Uncharacterized protein n=1 Tax=Heterorhabditis bacteriophora TaxID=37862 RepID=A0A1I7WU85_HETBA